MTSDYALLARFLRDSPFQPATAFWRAIEVCEVVRHLVPEGLGLDLGCGDGRVTQMVLERARPGTRPLVGVDPDPAEAGLATGLGIYQRVLEVPGDKIPAPNASFDWVFSNSVLEHIGALEPVLHEVARLLKPGGTFLFTVPSDGFHRCLKGPILPFVSRQAYLDDLDRRLAHKRYWSAADWRAQLLAEGLEVVDTVPYMPARAVRRWETISRFTAGVLYLVFRHRKAPIDIQRALHLRGPRLRIPGAASYLLARLLTLGIADGRDRNAEDRGFGCLLVAARKSSLPAQAAA